MFEVGKEYNFVTISAGEDGLVESSRAWTVAAVDGHLLHLQIPAQDEGLDIYLNDDDNPLAQIPAMPEQNMVLNTASAFFHSASPVTVEE